MFCYLLPLQLISNASVLNISVISGKPEVHPTISEWQKNFSKLEPPDFNFMPVSLLIKISPYGVMLSLGLFVLFLFPRFVLFIQ